MIDLADFQRRFYHDGPDVPETPELQTAEREYQLLHIFLVSRPCHRIRKATPRLWIWHGNLTMWK